MQLGRSLKISKALKSKLIPYLKSENGKTLNASEIAKKFIIDLDDTKILSRNGIEKIDDLIEVIDAIIIGNMIRKNRTK